MAEVAYPKLHFREPFEGRIAFEVPQKGWYDGLSIELEDGRKIQLFFYDPIRLGHELKLNTEHGEPYIAEPFMIVVPEVTEDAMRKAVSLLVQKEWFSGRFSL